MTVSRATDVDSRWAVRMDLAGDLHGSAVADLRLRWLEAIIIERPDELIIDVGALQCLSSAGLTTLVAGYVKAIGYGTSYRVVDARRDVRRVFEASGTQDMLTDSDDIGALLLALLVGGPSS